MGDTTTAHRSIRCEDHDRVPTPNDEAPLLTSYRPGVASRLPCQNQHCLNPRFAAGAPLCVGIDPVRDRLPAGDDLQVIQDFGLRIVDQLADLVPAVKIQSACYERSGPDGIAVRDQLALHAREAGLIVVLDAKRGDIGVSSEHYACAFSRWPGRLGHDQPISRSGWRSPFLEQARCLRLGSDKQLGGTALQTLPLQDGRTAHAVADIVRELGETFIDTESTSRLGAVVGDPCGRDC